MFLRPFHMIPDDTKIDFVSLRKVGFSLTIILMLVTIFSLFTHGLNLGIDFKGGILIEAKAENPVDVAALRNDLSTLGLGEIALQEFGAHEDILIRIQRQEGGEEEQQAAVAKVREKLGPSYDYRRVEVVGPTIGKELFEAGLLATLLAIAAIAGYVAVRFEWQFGLAAFAATLHDVFVTVGLYSFLDLDFNLTAIAALLTLAGYSINDTVVVFDRIREIMRRQKVKDLRTLINLSVNQTLSRTLMTALTTLLALIPLVLIGGQTLFTFSLALTWGILVGTYSSIYVAAALMLYMPPLKQLK
ncbi:MAG: protein translocase subunit SecF [Bdellovibrionales bacterium]